MALTRSFRETVQARAGRDAAFRQALLQEAAQALLDGDIANGRTALRACVNATIGFDALAEATRTPQKSLMRMLGSKGNPTAAKLFAVLAALQTAIGIHLEVRAVPLAA
jgi:DNA-binding phage protein